MSPTRPSARSGTGFLVITSTGGPWICRRWEATPPTPVRTNLFEKNGGKVCVCVCVLWDKSGRKGRSGDSGLRARIAYTDQGGGAPYSASPLGTYTANVCVCAALGRVVSKAPLLRSINLSGCNQLSSAVRRVIVSDLRGVTVAVSCWRLPLVRLRLMICSKLRAGAAIAGRSDAGSGGG